jgi:uncharacterized protein YlaN (UPF0358 family)
MEILMRGRQGKIRRQKSAVVVMEKLLNKYDEQMANPRAAIYEELLKTKSFGEINDDDLKKTTVFKLHLLKKKKKAKKCLENTLNNLSTSKRYG